MTRELTAFPGEFVGMTTVAGVTLTAAASLRPGHVTQKLGRQRGRCGGVDLGRLIARPGPPTPRREMTNAPIVIDRGVGQRVRLGGPAQRKDPLPPDRNEAKVGAWGTTLRDERTTEVSGWSLP